MVHLRILGPFDAVDVDGRFLDLGGPKQRAVLALLLVAQGQVVSVDRLCEDLWDGEPPRRALVALQAYVSNLRKILEPHRPPRSPATVLVSRAPGYAITASAADVNAWRFEQMVSVATEIADPASRRNHLREAMTLWRGHALADFASTSWAAAEAARLEELRVVASERLVQALLDCDEAPEAVLVGHRLCNEHPLREESWRLFALALYASGRQGDALAAIRRARNTLADELGIDPGPALAQLEADVLAQRIPIRVRQSPITTADGNAPQPHRTDGRAQLLGRAEHIGAVLNLAERRRSSVCLISGSAGVGKSALLAHLAEFLTAPARPAHGEDWLVATGQCPEDDGAPAAWAWVQVIRSLSATQVGFGAGLDVFVDNAVTPPLRQETDESRFLLHQRLVQDLADLARIQQVAVFIDDAHRADAETLTLLTTVASTAPVLVVVSYRPEEIGRHFAGALATLAPLDPLRIELSGLPVEDATRLVQAESGVTPAPAIMETLLDRTGGNPFYLRESARLMRSEGALVATSAVPAGVRDVLRRRFHRLPDIAVSILRLTALIGRTADIEVVLHAAEVNEEVVFDALDAGMLAGLLDISDTTVTFTHSLVRETLVDDIPRLRRMRWHRRIADAVHAVHPDDVSALAHHHGQALTPVNAEQAVEYALAAADLAATRFSHDVIAENLQIADRALARMPAADTAARVRVLCRLSSARLADGSLEEARATRLQALSLARAADRADLVVEALLAWETPTPWITRRYGTVDEFVVDAVQECLAIPDLPVGTRCRLLAVLVEETYGERDEDARGAAVEAVRLSDEIADPTTRGLAINAYLALSHNRTARAERCALADELIRLSPRCATEVFGLIGHFAHVRLAAVVGDIETAAAHLSTMDTLADRYRWGQARAVNLMAHAMQAHVQGDTDRAAATYVQAHQHFTLANMHDADAVLGLSMFTLAVTTGRLADLVGPLTAIVSDADDAVKDPLALAMCAAGRREEARALRRAIRPVRQDFFHSLLLAVRGMAVVELCETAEAGEAFERLAHYRGQLAGADTGCFVVGPVDTVLGDLAALLGRRGVAREFHDAAVVLADRCGNTVWSNSARSRLDANQAIVEF
ncbi:AAA family ATPase [Skermania sp. ID1734]|uniref:BTAD domain-containing putative transcriptional regulator n=1 Tax=Skermania sp. ID1734 TaxID=2597516 RepID=UPI001180800F|nr:BTAD domain-containing putative transcriptional regulator [Skermania sp. ID1734]TSD93632.1 AAA family ATPase [Skermania sp. ID1734]